RPGPFQAFSALLLAAAPVALWAWLRRRADEATALLAASLFASCPLVLAQSGVVMSEAPYLLFFLLMLRFAEKRRAAAAGAAGAALLMTRTAGLAVMPALLIPFARARRWGEVARAAALPAAAWALWAGWSWSRGGTVGKFDLLPSTYAAGAWSKPFLIAAGNARYYAAEWGGCFLPPSWADGAAAVALGAVLGAAAAWGLASALRRRADDPAAWSLLGTAALLALWGWQYERYMIPLLPLLLWALAAGLGRRAKPALAGLLVLQLAFQTLPRLGRPSPWAEPELARTYAWLASRPAPNLLSSTEPVRDGWLSDLPSVSLPVPAKDEEFARALKAEGVRYVLRAEGQDYGLRGDESSALRRTVERLGRLLDDPRRFRKVHEEPAERAAVYEPL
ncbi:MAG TPA: hypothetical protein VN915_05360, partial [Elusimicrobiota bacterium]|nr:hypothetical protein [Elusimicrobiota bacterium]